MKATIWHNPNCGTSRNTLALLQARDDLELEVVEYLKHPPSRGTDAEERGLIEADDDTVLDAMAAEPILIERPLVETEKGVRLARPAEKVSEIL